MPQVDSAPNSTAPAAAAAVGLVGLAAAMGIGRFAFTPLLPLMQSAGQLTLAEGSWLASANYLGYLAGALLCWKLAPSPGRAARGGLLVVAAATTAMAASQSFALWWLLRFAAGVASAYVLVGVSAWTLAVLARSRGAPSAGVVFAGVGIGIAIAGLAGVAAGVLQLSPQVLWIALGGLAALACVATWAPLHAATVAPAAAPTAGAGSKPSLRLVLCYGVLGLGYIIPATYLPAQARALIDDPLVFGWTWPVFGIAAAVSTLLAARLFGGAAPRRLWAGGNVVMAFGIALGGLVPSVWALLVAAVCVGGTFVVITMAGMQEARIVGGAAAPRLMAAMTATFALGQLLGPLWVGAAAADAAGMQTPSVLAAVLVLGAAAALVLDPSRRGAQRAVASIPGEPRER